MIGGVNFQPGQASGVGAQPRSKQGNSVQEAIKILSLRLPKQVGPNALAPAALLNSQGSGGNPRVDSVVNTVMGRMFPTGAPSGPAAPMVPSGSSTSNQPVLGPSPGENTTMPVSSPIRFDGSTRPPDHMPLADIMPTPTTARAPRISPINDAPRPGEVRGTPAPDVAPPSAPPQRFDVNPPAQPADPVAPPAPTQDPWNDLMMYLRRNAPPDREPMKSL